MPSSTKRIIEAGSCVPCEARVKYLTIQHNRLGINFFSIQKCNCGIRPIGGKMRSTVWTVYLGRIPIGRNKPKKEGWE